MLFCLGQGGNSPRPAEADLCWQAAGGRQDSLRLQHPEGVHPSPGKKGVTHPARSRTTQNKNDVG